MDIDKEIDSIKDALEKVLASIRSNEELYLKLQGRLEFLMALKKEGMSIVKPDDSKGE